MNKFLTVAIIAFLTIACTNQDQKAQQELYDSVMATHDEVMPEMGTLMKLTKQLKSQADSIVEADSAFDIESSELQLIINDLDLANESMMQWMREFEPLEEGTPHGEVIQYLTEQKQRIDKVREDMLNSKDRAEKYLLEN